MSLSNTQIDPAPRNYPPGLLLNRRSARGPASFPATTTLVEIAAWLIGDAMAEEDLMQLFESLAWRLKAAGLPFERSALSVGTHTITFKADDGIITSTDAITIIIYANPNEAPAVASKPLISPGQFAFEPDNSISSTVVYVDNQNSAISITWVATASHPWLSLNLTTGTTPGDLTATYSATGLITGTHYATLTVTSDDAPDETATAVFEVTIGGASADKDVYLPIILKNE